MDFSVYLLSLYKAVLHSTIRLIFLRQGCLQKYSSLYSYTLHLVIQGHKQYRPNPPFQVYLPPVVHIYLPPLFQQNWITPWPYLCQASPTSAPALLSFVFKVLQVLYMFLHVTSLMKTLFSNHQWIWPFFLFKLICYSGFLFILLFVSKIIKWWHFRAECNFTYTDHSHLKAILCILQSSKQGWRVVFHFAHWVFTRVITLIFLSSSHSVLHKKCTFHICWLNWRQSPQHGKISIYIENHKTHSSYLN